MPHTAHVAPLFRLPFDEGSYYVLVDFTLVVWVLHTVMRRAMLPRMDYIEALTNIKQWILDALISHIEFGIVYFMICEIEDTI